MLHTKKNTTALLAGTRFQPKVFSLKIKNMASRIMAVKGLNAAASFRGQLYVNVIVVPSTNADQFEKFCKLNKSCCPKLQRSAPGDTTTKPLVRDSDIRYGQMLF